MLTDLPLEQLKLHRTTAIQPGDLLGFWDSQISAARREGGEVVAIEVPTSLTAIRTWDVTFPGWNGQPIRGWLRAPAVGTQPLPTIVEYVGYGGGRGAVLDNLTFAAAGYAHLLMDTRGQGSSWSIGTTPDDAFAGPQAPGMMTRGITSPSTYYYARLFTDAVLAVDAVRQMPLVDPQRVAVHGISQGGGTAIVAGALAEDVSAVVARVPFLCDIPRAITITDSAPYSEIVQYLAIHREQTERVLEVLSYFDATHFAAMLRCPLLVTAALMDDIVPPSGPFAAFNACPTEKEMIVRPFNRHEGGGADDTADALRFLRAILGL